jgi:hypothetical protein
VFAPAVLELAADDLRRGTCLGSSMLSGGASVKKEEDGCRCSLLRFSVNEGVGGALGELTGLRLAMLAKVEAAAGMAHV